MEQYANELDWEVTAIAEGMGEFEETLMLPIPTQLLFLETVSTQITYIVQLEDPERQNALSSVGQSVLRSLDNLLEPEVPDTVRLYGTLILLIVGKIQGYSSFTPQQFDRMSTQFNPVQALLFGMLVTERIDRIKELTDETGYGFCMNQIYVCLGNLKQGKPCNPTVIEAIVSNPQLPVIDKNLLKVIQPC